VRTDSLTTIFRQCQRLCIQCALEAGLYKEALTLTRDRREKVGSDPLFDQIQLRLETQSAPDSLKYLFSRGS
ncbi:MAG: hypothetical protein AAFP02_17580, partial [Bacteroidota bacterium]